jgi:hypothetical protein
MRCVLLIKFIYWEVGIVSFFIRIPLIAYHYRLRVLRWCGDHYNGYRINACSHSAEWFRLFRTLQFKPKVILPDDSCVLGDIGGKRLFEGNGRDTRGIVSDFVKVLNEATEVKMAWVSGWSSGWSLGQLKIPTVLFRTIGRTPFFREKYFSVCHCEILRKIWTVSFQSRSVFVLQSFWVKRGESSFFHAGNKKNFLENTFVTKVLLLKFYGLRCI